MRPITSMDLDVQQQLLGLDPRQGDISPFHNWNANWGHVLTLHPGDSKTIITTQMFPINLPIAYQLRFAATPAGPFTPAVPPGVSVRVQLLKSIDLRTGGADEQFDLLGGQSQTSCTIICRKLSIVLSSIGSPEGGDVTVQAAICPIENIDCGELTGKNAPYTNTFLSFVPASVATTTLATPNIRRAQVLVQNTSTNADLIIAFGPGANFAGPVGTFILPRNTFGIYESPLDGYGGIVTGAWTAGPNGGALVTEGSH